MYGSGAYAALEPHAGCGGGLLHDAPRLNQWKHPLELAVRIAAAATISSLFITRTSIIDCASRRGCESNNSTPR